MGWRGFSPRYARPHLVCKWCHSGTKVLQLPTNSCKFSAQLLCPTVLSLIHVVGGAGVANTWPLHGYCTPDRRALAQLQQRVSNASSHCASSVCGNLKFAFFAARRGDLLQFFQLLLAVEMNCKPIKVDFSTSSYSTFSPPSSSSSTFSGSSSACFFSFFSSTCFSYNVL